MPAPSPIIKGITTIRWGTNGAIASGGAGDTTGLSAAIVKSVKHTPLGGEPIIIEDNNGFAAVLVLLVDGDELEFNCVDDSAINWPQKGDVLLSTSTTTALLTIPGQAAAKSFIVIDNNANTERKREGERSLKVMYRPGISL